MNEEKPTLYVCHGDEKGAKLHPCAKVQKALQDKGIEYDKVIGGQGNPLPFLRKPEKRQVVREATGQENLPSMQLPDGTLLTSSKEILDWVGAQA
jgi:hypothetical protein